MVSLKASPIGSRVASAVVSYVTYLGQSFCPTALAAYYPPPAVIPAWKIAASILLLAAISAGAFALRRRCPWLLVGWLWYLGMLVPVIGLVQVGEQATADRYMYLPQIGLCLALTWAAAEIVRRLPDLRRALVLSSALGLAVLGTCAWRQVSYWKDSRTLWTHALACTSRNSFAHNNLGLALAEEGDFGAASDEYRQAIQCDPGCVLARVNLGNVLARLGQADAAIAYYEAALEIDRDFAEAHNNLGAALAGQGKFDAAIPHFQRAVELKPDYAEARRNLELARMKRERKSRP